ncbi:MAG TPA: 4Fe-4S dicluster domain-containing protein [Anaeromyxobacter sp.]|nr:4Fe-4S dicluster domain-containing protein [Anaeromyxobacter sp.]
MSADFQLAEGSLDALFAAMTAAGRRIVGPRASDGRVEIGEVRSAGELARDGRHSVASAKVAAFPRVEKILSYRAEGRELAVEDPALPARPTVLFGLTPCEARGFGALSAILNWGTPDRFFNARLEQTTVVAIACTRSDEACFCTAVGGGPDHPGGSDLLLHPLTGGGYEVEVLTEKGRALVALAADRFQPPEGTARTAPAQVEAGFQMAEVTAKLPRRFDEPIWTEQSLRCLGCGACAYVCPTCACFDIQDEADARGGVRLRCWDSCAFRIFTLHASGHNPREKQGERWRQRLYHKFSYMPERLGVLGCVGCGKCSRACPVDMDLKEHLTEIAKGS